jgi:hypothetical protein
MGASFLTSSSGALDSELSESESMAVSEVELFESAAKEEKVAKSSRTAKEQGRASQCLKVERANHKEAAAATTGDGDSYLRR